MGSGFSFLFPSSASLSATVGHCLACLILFPNLVCPVHLSDYGMFWPWFVSASARFFFFFFFQTDLG